MQSNFGWWLDVFFDKLNDFLLILCLAIGVYLRQNDPNMLILGILLMGMVFSIQFILVINDSVFKQERKSNDTIVSNMKSHKKNRHVLYIGYIIMFFRNHISLQHNSFLFWVSLFAIINQPVAGLFFLCGIAFISLVLSIAINFYKLR